MRIVKPAGKRARDVKSGTIHGLGSERRLLTQQRGRDGTEHDNGRPVRVFSLGPARDQGTRTPGNPGRPGA